MNHHHHHLEPSPGEPQLPGEDHNLPRRRFRRSAQSRGALRDPADPRMLRDVSQLRAEAGLHRGAEADQHDPVRLRRRPIRDASSRNRARSHRHKPRLVGSGQTRDLKR